MRTGRVNDHRHTARRQAYGIDAGGVSGVLTSPEHVPTEVVLHDVRDPRHAVRFDTDGIAFVTAPTAVDLRTPGWKPAYEDELRALLHREVGAVDVRIFDHTLRVDDPDALRRPARNVHTDYSPDGARARLEALLGRDEAARWEAGHYAFLNVWRPVSQVVRTAPLGFVQPRTVRPDDWVTLDLVYPDRVGQILGLVPHPDHQWLYRSAMTADEVVLFNVHDNRGQPAVAHSAIDLVSPAPPRTVRESLETRTLVRYRT